MDTELVDEAARLAAIRRYDILDTPPDGAFDRITALAARVCGVPISTITIVDEDRIWFKSTTGIDVDQIGRDPGLCASAILLDSPHVVTDAITDPRTLNNPLVRGDLGLRFYVGLPLITADGHRLGTLNIIDTNPRDVSDDELATLTDLAAIVVDELELRLAARRAVDLRAAQDAAEFRGVLLSGISHEMRTPISILLGLASLDPDDEFDDAAMRSMMRRHVRQLDRLVSRYLDFTALEGGRAPVITVEPTDLAAIVAEAVEVLDSLTEVEVRVDAGAPRALADPERTRQIVLELLDNAARFSPGGCCVSVEVRALGADEVAVTVADQGPGIEPEVQDRIFDKLFRGHDGPGSGLGLYVARALALAQDGSLALDSTPGQGSRFTLSLPATDRVA